MNVWHARKMFARRILPGVAGLILIAAPIEVTAAAGEPYGTPDNVAAYQAYTVQYGQPIPPSGRYPATRSYVQRDQLKARLNYAEAQYNQARRSGDRAAAKHWKKDIKHLRRELSRGGHAEGPGYGASAPAYIPPQGPYYPPASAYASPGPAYAQPYPPARYPPPGYPSAAAASQYGAPGPTGSMGALGSLLGPLLGGGAIP